MKVRGEWIHETNIVIKRIWTLTVTWEYPCTLIYYKMFHFCLESRKWTGRTFLATSESFQLVKCEGLDTLYLHKLCLYKLYYAFWHFEHAGQNRGLFCDKVFPTSPIELFPFTACVSQWSSASKFTKRWLWRHWKTMNADSDLWVSVYINLLEYVPFSPRKPKMNSANVPSHVGIISAGEVCRTSHPLYTQIVLVQVVTCILTTWARRAKLWALLW